MRDGCWGEGDRARERHYGQRLARRRLRHVGFEKLAKELVPALLERGGRLPYSELFDLFEAVGRRTFPLSGTNATQFIQDAEHSGLLAPAEGADVYSMPIPPFAGHLLGNRWAKGGTILKSGTTLLIAGTGNPC